MPLVALGAIGIAGSIGGAAISSSAAGKAASTQANAANYAADKEYQASQDALNFQKQQYATSQEQMQPWLQSGQGALSNLNYLMGIGGQQAPATATTQPGTAIPAPGSGTSQFGSSPVSMATTGPAGGGVSGMPSSLVPVSATGSANPGTGTSVPAPNTSLGSYGSLMTPYSGSFTAPTGLTEQNDPGYQARLKLGTDALQRSAAARGGVLTGGTAKALDTYGQDYASNEYGNVYNRALTDYTTKYNAYNTDQANQYNKLASLSGLGQQSANQLATQGQAASNNVTSNLLSTAQNMGQQANNAAAATASGYVGGANAWNGALSGGSQNIQQLMLMKQMGMI